MRTMGWLAAAVATVLALTACGSRAGGHRGGSAAAAVCAAKAPQTAPPRVGQAREALVPANAVIAVVCQYAVGFTKGKGANLDRRITLRGPAAAGLAAVLDSAGPMTTSAIACVRPAVTAGFVQKIVFGYAAAPAHTAVVAYPDCNLVIVTSRRRAGVLATQPAAGLLFYTTFRLPLQGPVTPDLIGLTAAQATAAASRQHFSAAFDASVLDPHAASGAVVFQVPPPGMPDAGPGNQIGFILAVHSEPACMVSQLAGSYRAGGLATGSDFGTLLIRDTSAQACKLTGPLQVTGLGAGGQAVTGTARVPVVGPAVLSPAGQADALVGQILLSADYRDDPASADGLCEQPFWVVPASWRIVLPAGQSLSVANADPGNPVSRLVPSGGFVTCRGQLDNGQPASVGVP